MTANQREKRAAQKRLERVLHTHASLEARAEKLQRTRAAAEKKLSALRQRFDPTRKRDIGLVSTFETQVGALDAAILELERRLEESKRAVHAARCQIHPAAIVRLAEYGELQPA